MEENAIKSKKKAFMSKVQGRTRDSRVVEVEEEVEMTWDHDMCGWDSPPVTDSGRHTAGLSPRPS